MSVHLSVCPHGTSRLPLGGFSWNLMFEIFFFENVSKKFKFHQNPTRIMGASRGNLLTFISNFFLEWEMFQKKSCGENQNTRCILCKFFFRKSCRLWDNVEKIYCRAGHATDVNIIQRMRIASEVPRATNTHSEYVMLIAFPLQQWLREHVSVLRCTLLFF